MNIQAPSLLMYWELLVFAVFATTILADFGHLPSHYRRESIRGQASKHRWPSTPHVLGFAEANAVNLPGLPWNRKQGIDEIGVS